jgi:hypothetical protein
MLALLLMLALALFSSQHAAAAPVKGQGHVRKVSRDLQEAVDSGKTKARWVRDDRGRRMVQVVIVGNGDDRDMTALKAEIQRVGGSVEVSMPGLLMLTANVPARRVTQLAERADVRNVVPNRPTRRTASTLEAITGATVSPVRTSSTKASYSGLDGTGIGIAIVDSGVMKNHEAFNNASGITRVVKNVQTLTTTLADWTNGYDSNTSLQPGSTALASYEAAIDNAANLGKTVLAEGIESNSQLMQLHDLGCDHGQGFHLSRPLTVDEVGNLLVFASAEQHEQRLRLHDSSLAPLMRH